MNSIERILLVESDAPLRALVRDHLAKQGYAVCEARAAKEALALLDGEARIDLLVTDILKPRMRQGAALADEARRRRPGLKVLHVNDGTAPPLSIAPSGSEARTALLRRVSHALGHWAVEGNDLLQCAYRYWLEKAAGRSMPLRHDLDPTEIKELLPNLSIYERFGDPPRHRCRLMGTKVVEAIGYSIANQCLEEGKRSANAAFLAHLLDQVIDIGVPFYASSVFRTPESTLSTERLMMPFRLADGGIQAVAVQSFCRGARPVTLLEIKSRPWQRSDSIEWQPGAPLGFCTSKVS